MALVVVLSFGAAPLAATPEPLSAEAKAAHALNRLGYGPRPGDIDRLVSRGIETWMRAQLHPEYLPDEAIEAEVAKLGKLKLTSADFSAAQRVVIRARRERQASAEEAMAGAASPSPTPRSAPNPAEGAARQLVPGAIGELQYAKLLRAVYSEHQLEEVLVDFWFNHFNVDAREPAVAATLVSYEQEAIRPHVFGKFRALLGATARSGAMMVYLDNARSSKTQELGAIQQRAAAQLRADTTGMSLEDALAAAPTRRGLNENYGRELLELHTLGVEGGYTQPDVQAVARAFTGWTVDPRTGDFRFRRQLHDSEPKTVLGTPLRRNGPNGGMSDGEQVLDLLAAHPATARHLASKLAQRFVNDTPPEVLIERVAHVFLQTGGDLRATYEALFFSPEFFSPEHHRAKTKSPFEFLASSLRASGATLGRESDLERSHELRRRLEGNAVLNRGGDRLARLPRKTALLHLIELGQPLYAWGPPTGFPEDSSSWVSAGALVSRLNFALALTADQVADAQLDLRTLLVDTNPDQPDAVVNTLAAHLLGGPPSPNTRHVLLAEAAPATEGETSVPNVAKVLALLLGSPEFQRR